MQQKLLRQLRSTSLSLNTGIYNQEVGLPNLLIFFIYNTMIFMVANGLCSSFACFKIRNER